MNTIEIFIRLCIDSSGYECPIDTEFKNNKCNGIIRINFYFRQNIDMVSI
jgi:hypothetical protein